MPIAADRGPSGRVACVLMQVFGRPHGQDCGGAALAVGVVQLTLILQAAILGRCRETLTGTDLVHETPPASVATSNRLPVSYMHQGT